jgi:UDP-N-acetylmuramoyl-L-alanyl-D-glutamate--2,6-diaminopimelate ligase
MDWLRKVDCLAMPRGRSPNRPAGALHANHRPNPHANGTEALRMIDRAAQARGLSLRELLPNAVLVSGDIRVTSCCADSRQCRPGDLFVALRGSAADGHDFIKEAIRRGAAALVADRPLPDVALPVCHVDDTRDAHARLCQALAGHPARKLKMIGITGTNGKTTTSYLTASVLAAGGFRTGLIGTLGCFDGDAWEDSAWTTPPPAKLARWLAQMANADCTHAVMEVSSHALDQRRVAGIDFDVACLTNVTRDHLDYHSTLKNYRSAKAKLFEHLLPEGFAIINVDDPVAESFLSHLDGPVLTVGIRAAAEITALPVEQFRGEQTFLLTVGGDTVPVRTPLIGEHNISNCLLATAIGLAYGIDLPTIVRGIEAVPRVPGRLDRVECGQPFGVFIDYAHTADALAGCLKTLRGITSGRLICVFGAGGDRDKTKRPRMGRAVASAADVAVVTNDNPRGERPAAIIEGVLAGFADRSAVEVVPDRRQAIEWALAQAGPGDCVLIAGKGHETHQIIGDERHEFDDRAVARQWLYASYGVIAA